MNKNMKQWLAQLRDMPEKKALPVLSFPAVQLMGISVRELISDSDRQAQGMKLVADRTDAAAAVSLMDLSVEAECFGAPISVSDDEVPTVKSSVVSTPEEVEALAVPKIGAGRTQIYIDAIKKAVEMIEDRPVFAGIIGPYSLAGRLLDVTEIMFYCYDEPEMVQQLLDKVTDFLIAYGQAYKDAGADGIVMAEPLAGLLSPALAEEFSAPYVKRIVEALQTDDFLVIYHNCGNSTIQMIDSILDTGAAAYHFGNAINMEEMMTHIPPDTVAMGNVDPAGQFRNGTPESIKEETWAIMEACCKYPNFVISSGCDIPPLSKWENIDAFFEAVQEFYEKKRMA
ncbi:uroporphyrinogen decarboxylase family protein [Eisenbergiella sp.]